MPVTNQERRVASPVELRFAELGDFLAARRAEITPEQVGLPGGGTRRLPGLRREEVAMLAGIGASWYTWIEQGRAKNVSPEILGAVAHVLKLDEAQCRYVMRLAGYAPPRRPRPVAESGRRLCATVVDGFLPGPAYVIDRYWDVVAANQAAVDLLGLDGPHPNYLEMLFLDPLAASRFPCWSRDAADAVSQFRAQSGEFLGDPRLTALVGHLGEGSRIFADLWTEHRVSDAAGQGLVVRHPGLGQVSFTQIRLDLALCPGHQLILLSPHGGGAADQPAPLARSVGVPA